MKILSLLTTFVLAIGLMAQEATIKFELTMESDDPQAQAQMAMMANSSMTMFMKGKMFRQEMNMGNGLIITTTIVDGEQEKGIVLIEGMMGKTASPFDSNEQKEEDEAEEADVEIEFTDETKEILGFDCKKAIIYDEEGNEAIYWYTEEIALPDTEQKYINEKIPGMPLEFSVEQPQFKMVFKAIEYDDKVKKAKEVFDIKVPEGYTEKSMDEIQQMTGGQ